LPGYGFFWFELDTARAKQERFGPSPVPELFTLVYTRSVGDLLAGRELSVFERTIAPQFLGVRRWFAGKGTGLADVKVKCFALLQSSGRRSYLLIYLVTRLRDGGEQNYFTPLAIDEPRDEEKFLPYAVARARRGARIGLVYDVDADPNFGAVIVSYMMRQAELPASDNGLIRFSKTRLLHQETSVKGWDSRRLDLEQSNSSFLVGESMILKMYRRLGSGKSPEIEMGRFLTEVAQFDHTPPLLGYAEHIDENGNSTPLCVLQAFINNQGDAWAWTLDALRLGLEGGAMTAPKTGSAVEEEFASYRPYAVMLGRRTAEMHRALATPTDDPAFAIEPLTLADILALANDATRILGSAFRALDTALRQLKDESTIDIVQQLLARRDDCERFIKELTQEPFGATKIRIHGDYHLGQILIVQDDVVIVDFEGEPAGIAEMRRAKQSPLRDVAGMLRSFAYATEAALNDVRQRLTSGTELASDRAAQWCDLASKVFLASYEETIAGSPVRVTDALTRHRLLRLYLLTKALYEISYEANSRPAWIRIPVHGVLSLLDEAEKLTCAAPLAQTVA
jgi:maltose alpha-D-glucosyltransferase/alpha-amylase